MTEIMNTRLGEMLKRTVILLDYKRIWYMVFQDPKLKQDMLRWIQQDQLFKEGVDEDGDVIGTYSQFTQMINPQKVAGEHYTLFDSGEFYRSMIITAGWGETLIDADTVKMESENWWRDNDIKKDKILGLTDENKSKLASRIIIAYRKAVKEILPNY